MLGRQQTVILWIAETEWATDRDAEGDLLFLVGPFPSNASKKTRNCTLYTVVRKPS